MATSMIMLPRYAGEFEIVKETFSFSGSTVASNSYRAVSKTITKSGYYPIGVAAWEVSGTYGSFQHPYKYHLGDRQIGSATLYSGLYNRNGNNAYAGDLYVWVIWQKVVS